MEPNLHALIADSFGRLADRLDQQPPDVWGPAIPVHPVADPSCRRPRDHARPAHQRAVRAALAEYNGDFQRMSDTIAVADGDLPISEHLKNLRSRQLAEWEPPGGGAIGALNHAVVHGLDITNALGLPRAFTDETARVILDSLTNGGIAGNFGIDLSGVRLTAEDLNWSSGSGRDVRATAADIISLACHRTLTDGQRLN